jgi:hypothetical protein
MQVLHANKLGYLSCGLRHLFSGLLHLIAAFTYQASSLLGESLRWIDVCMITISRLPAAEEHESCSSAAGRPTYMQAPFLGLSVLAEEVYSHVACLLVRSRCTTRAAFRERGPPGYGFAVEAPTKRS